MNWANIDFVRHVVNHHHPCPKHRNPIWIVITYISAIIIIKKSTLQQPVELQVEPILQASRNPLWLLLPYALRRPGVYSLKTKTMQKMKFCNSDNSVSWNLELMLFWHNCYPCYTPITPVTPIIITRHFPMARDPPWPQGTSTNNIIIVKLINLLESPIQRSSGGKDF